MSLPMIVLAPTKPPPRISGSHVAPTRANAHDIQHSAYSDDAESKLSLESSRVTSDCIALSRRVHTLPLRHGLEATFRMMGPSEGHGEGTPE